MKKILILSPETFSATGGIQSMSRTLTYLLHQWSKKNNWRIHLNVLNDPTAIATAPYLPALYFRGFRKSKICFTLNSIWKGINSDILIVTHVNLSFPALLVRLFNPHCKIWLVAHGTEVWRPLSGWRKTIWQIADQFICVSHFTKDKIIALHHANPAQCCVLNNITDPFLKLPENFKKPTKLLRRYGLRPTDKVIFTLTRMTTYDKEKGYDQVIKAISKIRQTFPNLIYLLAGPWDQGEKKRIKKLVASSGMSHNFILAGFIEQEELSDHYLLADLFVLPSKKEGFGIVFAEAMAHGLPVICGNKDGSKETIGHEGMGTAIDPDDTEALELAIRKKLHYSLTTEFKKSIQQESLKRFNQQHYINSLIKLIANE